MSAPRTKLPCTLVPYEARFAGAFRAINLSWISSLFRVEAHDEATLSDPCAWVAAGGFILVAVAAADSGTISVPFGIWELQVVIGGKQRAYSAITRTTFLKSLIP